MKALILKRYGATDALEFAEVAHPTIRPDEILVQVHAAGVNPIDNMIPKGMFKPILKFDPPAVMGSDLAGTVVEVGSRVSRFKVGDAVFASVFDLGAGSFAEFVSVPERAAARKPANLSFAEAASLPMVSLTAWQAFKERMRLEPGQKVFIPAGAGGIGTFAIQLAKQLGATVGTTTSPANVDLVRALGADVVVDYKRQARGMNVVMKFVFGLLSRKIRRLARQRGASDAFMFVRPDGAQLAAIGELVETGRAKGKVVLRMIAD